MISWHEMFMMMAVVASARSKDPSTKVGCILVDINNHIVGEGYNGMVSGVDETVVPWGREGQFLDTKYPYVIHAEANAILHSPNSHLLRGGSAYTTLYPCNECAKMLASVGIKSVYYMENKYSHTDSAIAASRIFEWCGIATHQIELSSENIVNTIKSLGLP